MLTFTSGNMFDDASTIKINTVNCVGVMGKGVALAFKIRFPEMFACYKQACVNGDVKPGQLHVWQGNGQCIVNFPTKRHWRDASRYEDIEVGLISLRKLLAPLGKVKVSIPALGCGHGGLDWNKVSEMIKHSLADLDAEIFVYTPQDSHDIK